MPTISDSSTIVSTAANAPQNQLGRYSIVKELGRGAMGVVYQAVDPVLGRTVAIKTIILPADPSERAEYEARFLQEAKAAGGLNHPNIITVHDVGREGPVAYMAMELLAGVELREMMSQTRLPVPQALDIAAQIADGLAFAHESGVVHRDIKPTNIMIVRGGQVKIMDFGIARMRVSEVKTQTGVLLGSPKYMSPEQVIGSGIDHRSDIFALGVMLYEMVTGNPPFGGADITQLMYQIAHATPAAPSRVNPALPTTLDTIVARALAKEPGARYGTASELAADLRGCGQGLASLPAAASGAGSTLRIDGDSSRTVRLNSRTQTGGIEILEATRKVQATDALPATTRAEGGGERTVRINPRHSDTLRTRMAGEAGSAQNSVHSSAWAWLSRYVLVIVMALVLGAFVSDLELFKQTALGTNKLTASKFARFLGYGGALLVFWLASLRSAHQLHSQGGKAASFGSLLVSLATLIVVVIGNSVLGLIVNPFLDKDLRNVYDWVFVTGITAAAFWLAFTIFNQAQPMRSILKPGNAEETAHSACMACGAELPATGEPCSACGASGLFSLSPNPGAAFPPARREKEAS